ncbi:hypothetical protein [Plantactinospora sp. WMMB782]|uniref:hypothetical protein n=1 Tax=Plantactinospora sp. WMMB782 TaxID=3404121 RepID=UPI003B928489
MRPDPVEASPHASVSTTATNRSIAAHSINTLVYQSAVSPFPPPSAHETNVRERAPDVLLDREEELAELAAFCAGDEPYVWWQGDPWAGKSALLAWFVLHPPADCDVVSFFVNGTVDEERDSAAFVTTMLSQLLPLVGDDQPGGLGGTMLSQLFRTVLDSAAARAARTRRRLVLVVDGLDEDQSRRSGRELASIAALLPRRPGTWVRLVVSGRPHTPLPDDLLDRYPDHPLVGCRVRVLKGSPHAKEVERRAHRELRRLLLDGDDLQRDVLGLLATSGGGLSPLDLEELTEQSPYVIEHLLDERVARLLRTRTDRWAVAERQRQLYLFGHATLLAATVDHLGARTLDRHRAALHAWAARYQGDGWPAATPTYLLRGYPRLLEDRGDLDRLDLLAGDSGRHRLMRARTGGDALALAEIQAAHRLLVASPAPDLARSGRLAVHHDLLTASNANVPTRLPALWAALGQLHRAESLAGSINDPTRRGQAMAAVAYTVAERGDLPQAIRMAGDIVDRFGRAQAYAMLAGYARRHGDAATAEMLSIAAARPAEPTRALALLAARSPRVTEPTMVEPEPEITEPDRAEPVDPAEPTDTAPAAGGDGAAPAEQPSRPRVVLPRHLRRILDSPTVVPEPAPPLRELAVAAKEARDAGDYARAEELALGIEDEWLRARTLAATARDLMAEGNVEAAERIVERITLSLERIRATTMIGDLRRAMAMTLELADPALRAEAAILVAKAAAVHGDLLAVDTLVGGIDQESARDQAWLTLAHSAQDRGELALAARFVNRVLDEAAAVTRIASIARSAAVSGDRVRAEWLLDRVTDPAARDQIRAALAVRAWQDGDAERFRADAELILDRRVRTRTLRRAETAPAPNAGVGASEEEVLVGPSDDELPALHDDGAKAGPPGEIPSAADDGSRPTVEQPERPTELGPAGYPGEEAADRAGEPADRPVAEPVVPSPAAASTVRQPLPQSLPARPIVLDSSDPALRLAAGEAWSALRRGDGDAAVAVVAGLSEPADRYLILTEFARFTADRGDHPLARRLAVGVDDQDQRVRLMVGLGRLAVAQGHTEEARRLVEVAGGFGARVRVMALIGYPADALAIARSVPEDEPDRAVFTDLVRTAGVMGDVDVALAAADHLTDPVHRDKTLFRVGQELRKRKQFDVAERLGTKIRDDALRARFLSTQARMTARYRTATRPAVLVSWQNAVAIEDPYERDTALLRLAQSAVHRRDWQHLGGIYRDVRDPIVARHLVLRAVRDGLVAGDLVQARAFCAEIDDPLLRAEALAALLEAAALHTDDAALHGDDAALRGDDAAEPAAPRVDEQLVNLVQSAMDGGHLELAYDAATRIGDALRRVRLLRAVARAAMEQAEILTAVIDRFEEELTRLTDGPLRLQSTGGTAWSVDQNLAERIPVVKDALRAGRLDEAVELFADVTDPVARDQVFELLSQSARDRGDWSQSYALASRIGSARRRYVAMAGLREAAARHRVTLEWEVPIATIEGSAATASYAEAKEALRLGDTARALDLAATTTAPAVRDRMLSSLAQLARDLGRPDDAESFVRAMENPLARRTALLPLLRLVAASGNVPRARALVVELADPDDRERFLLAVAKELITSYGVETVLPLLADFADRDQALLVLAQSAADRGDRRAAERIALRITGTTQRTTALRLATRQAAAAPRQPAPVAPRPAPTSPAPAPVVPPVGADRAARAAALRATVDNLLQHGDVSEAVAVIQAIDDPQLRDQLGVALVRRLAQTRRLLPAAAEYVGSIGRAERAQALTVVIDQAVHFGDRHSFEAVAPLLTDRLRHANALTALAERLLTPNAEDGPPPDDDAVRWAAEAAQQAEEVAREIRDERRHTRERIAVVQALDATGDTAAADLFAESIDDPFTRSRLMHTLTQSAARAGNLARAESLATDIVDPFERSRAMVLVVEAAVRADDLDRARRLVLDIGLGEHRVQALTAMACAAAGRGDTGAVDALVDEARATAWEIVELTKRGTVLVGLLEALIAAGALEQAERLQAEIPIPGFVSERLAIARGALDAVEQIPQRISDRRVRTRLLSAAARALAASGDLARACRFTARIDDPFERVGALAALLRGIPAGHDADAVENVLTELKRQVATISERTARARAHATLARVLGEIGMLEPGQRLAMLVGLPDERAGALADLLRWCRGPDQFHVVLASLERLVPALGDPADQARVLNEAAGTATRHGLPDTARRLMAQALSHGDWPQSMTVLAALDRAAVSEIRREWLRMAADDLEPTAAG